MQPDQVREPCTQSHQSQADDQAGLGQSALLDQPSLPAREQGTDQRTGEGHIRNPASDVEHGTAWIIVETG